MPDFVTDTHALIWYLEDSPRLGPGARECFNACERGESIIYVPTICLVEIVYLQEKGRIPSDMKAQFDLALQSGESGIVPTDLTIEVVAMMNRVLRTTVPDMPDRIIAATALCMELPLISRDRKIQLSGMHTVW